MKDPHLDRSGVPRNRLGIADADELLRLEAEVSALHIAQLTENGLSGSYDLAHLQAVHAHLFGDLDDRAGELRTVGIDKGGRSARRSTWPRSPPTCSPVSRPTTTCADGNGTSSSTGSPSSSGT